MKTNEESTDLPESRVLEGTVRWKRKNVSTAGSDAASGVPEEVKIESSLEMGTEKASKESNEPVVKQSKPNNFGDIDEILVIEGKQTRKEVERLNPSE